MNILKHEAVVLRNRGYSYGMIREELGISKSTLSNWFKDQAYVASDEAILRTTKGRAAYGALKKQQRLREIEALLEKGRDEIGVISERDILMVGLGIWLGEGSKTTEQIRVANSDPRIIKLWIRWLRQVCGLDDNHIVVRMHLYTDSDELACINYWQSITQLPRKCFRKTQYDRRSDKSVIKNGKLPYGTLHVLVRSNGNPEKGVKLHRRMMGWISGILDQ